MTRSSLLLVRCPPGCAYARPYSPDRAHNFSTCPSSHADGACPRGHSASRRSRCPNALRPGARYASHTFRDNSAKASVSSPRRGRPRRVRLQHRPHGPGGRQVANLPGWSEGRIDALRSVQKFTIIQIGIHCLHRSGVPVAPAKPVRGARRAAFLAGSDRVCPARRQSFPAWPAHACNESTTPSGPVTAPAGGFVARVRPAENPTRFVDKVRGGPVQSSGLPS